jgi:hypothetical protein
MYQDPLEFSFAEVCVAVLSGAVAGAILAALLGMVS